MPSLSALSLTNNHPPVSPDAGGFFRLFSPLPSQPPRINRQAAVTPPTPHTPHSAQTCPHPQVRTQRKAMTDGISRLSGGQCAHSDEVECEEGEVKGNRPTAGCSGLARHESSKD